MHAMGNGQRESANLVQLASSSTEEQKHSKLGTW